MNSPKKHRKINKKEETEKPGDKQLKLYENYFTSGMGSSSQKLKDFSKYVPRQALTNFLVRYELFKKIKDIQGSIIECGVHFGGGLMTFAKCSAIFEHLNYTRKIIGFDTFRGFPSLSVHDKGSDPKEAHVGGIASHSFDDLEKCISLYDSDRFIGHLSKIELVKGDAVRTIPKYLRDNPQTIVSLLYLDFDIYKPTKVALENFVPRMPKGSIIAFDELNNQYWPGETKAVLDTIGVRNFKIQRFSFESKVSYIVLE